MGCTESAPTVQSRSSTGGIIAGFQAVSSGCCTAKCNLWLCVQDGWRAREGGKISMKTVSFAHSIRSHVCRDGLVQGCVPCSSSVAHRLPDQLTSWEFIKNEHLCPHPGAESDSAGSRVPGALCARLEVCWLSWSFTLRMVSGQCLDQPAPQIRVAAQKTPEPGSQAGLHRNLCSTTY